MTAGTMDKRTNLPRYPHIRVAVRSTNPLTAISAIREALRQAGAGRREIARFSHQAFSCRDLDHLRRVCRGWVEVEAPGWRVPGSGSGSWPALGT